MHIFQIPIIAVGHHLNMLIGHVIGGLKHFFMAVTQDDIPVIGPAGCRGLNGWQDFQKPVNLSQRILSQLARIGNQTGR